jgi:hypothetical protein
MVLVAVHRCGCGQGHTKIAQFYTCPAPITDFVVRTHECGRRLRPLDSQPLGKIA